MARRIHLRLDLSVDELERRYRAAKEPHERSWWQILWLLARGQLAKDIAASTGYSRYWIGQLAKRYNAEGAEGMRNRQYTHSHRAAPLLAPEQLLSVRRFAAGSRHPASGRTVFHLAASVSIPPFEVELAEFAPQVGAGPTKPIVPALDRAGGHAGVRLRVPEHSPLLFLPPY